ncbi:hypothetical protein [Vibrio phage vB_VaS_L1]|nr:hypothetical protein [Vibrio phage vB_VaS_L1]
MRKKIVKDTLRRMITKWDYSSFGSVVKGSGIVDFKVLFTKACVLFFHIASILTAPVSVFIIIKIGRWAEVSNLKSWVKTMRRDRGFFHQHHYIEIKRHIKEHEKSYYLTLNW